MRIIAKKSLGQNFLSSEAALKKIAEALDLKAGEAVVEVGPGGGQLTDQLLKFGVKLTVIEKDARLIPELAKKYGNSIRIIEGDVLEELPKISENHKTQNTAYKLIGNIPYYLTGKLLRLVPDLPKMPSISVFTIQKEVAERICAAAGEMNLLAAAVRGWGKAEKLFILKRELFKPRPKVDSATIRITTQKQTANRHYYQALHHLFRQPRKTLGNNLKSLWKEVGLEKAAGLKLLASLNIPENSRPQNLTPENIKKLADIVYT